ncbi:hypothetical protein [Lacisediminihabitans sp. H27-G8]|uniref:GspE/PulE/PilB domain-containing protein n=1 Tax=Lacisediminihabitans sp. H27-G8 TaxID=3111909 RepID=UPI0038FCF549
MNPESDDSFAERAAFADLLVASGLVSAKQLARASVDSALSGTAVDALLVSQGALDPVALRSVLARAWNLPVLNLARTHVDHDLVDQWPDEVYLSENWFPVRDQSNGTVLVATSRIPDAARAERIAAVIASPVEFAAVASADIAAAIARAVKRRSRGRRIFLS